MTCYNLAMAKSPHPFSYQEIARAHASEALVRRGGLTVVLEVTPSGVVERAADLPWMDRSRSWMLSFLLCLEQHGREDCFCWWKTYWGDGSSRGAARLEEGNRPGSRYIGWKKSEKHLLLDNPLYADAWLREKQRALGAWIKKHGSLPPVASTSIPWAEKLLKLVAAGCSPSGAAERLKMPKGAVTHARRKHPELDAHLIQLGYPMQTWRGTYLPEGRKR